MRWSLRRGNRDADGHAPSAPVSGAPAATDSGSDPGWRAVAPLRSSWSAQPPLTVAPLTPRPPLTAEPPRRATARPLDVRPGETPDPGRVVGLASARPVALSPIVPAVPPAPYVLDRPPLRHAPSRPLVEHANLTEASDAYVGEPIAPPAAVAPPPPPPQASPFPASTRPPRPEPQVEAATDAGARFREALANLHKSGLPRYVSPSESGGEPPAPPAPPSQLPAVPPPGPAAPSTAPAQDGPRLTHRRNTLAQSRRLGLGAPLRQEGGEDGDAADGGDPDRAPAPQEQPPPAAPPPAPPAAAVELPPPPPPPPAGPPPAAREALQPAAAPVQPITDGTGRPTSSTAPLVFRARPAARVATEPATRPAPRAVVTRPPAELAQALRSSHGVDVADVQVHRDAAAANEARERRARAFTRGGRVFLPEEAGELNSAKARSLLAHELVHVAQQRRLGSSLPSEDTPEGQALEAEAQHAEHLYATDTFAEPELVHAPPPVSAGWVEERLTQHAFMTQPAGYPGAIQGLSNGTDQLINEVKFAATEVVKKAIDDGDLGGTGTGGGGAAGRGNAPLGVGIGNAQNIDEFRAQTLAALNAERRANHERELTNLNQLSQAEQDRITARYNDLLNQNREAITLSQMQFAVQQVANQQHANLSWTPQTGFQTTQPGTTPTTPGTGGTTPGTGGTTPNATTPNATTPGGTTTPTSTTPGGTPPPRATAPRTTTPVTPPQDDGYDIGVGHAHTETEFQDQVLVALNLDRPADQQLTWAQMSSGDKERIHQRWVELSAAQAEQARARRLQNALRQHATASRTAATTPSTTTNAATTGAAAGAVVGAQVADARHAAEHTNDVETDSGVTNTTASGHRAISVDRIDMDDLVHQLYHRLHTQLRTELLIDRERAGLLTDFR